MYLAAPKTVTNWISSAFKVNLLQDTRLPWIDYLKGLTIILVVYRHVLVGLEYSGINVPEILENANLIFFNFRMPLFFLLSGIFIATSLKKRSASFIIKNKFETLLYPYLVWAFIQVSLQILFSKFTNANRGIMDYLYIFYQPRNLDQLWYLPALFNATVVFVLLKSKLHTSPRIQLILGVGLLFMGSYCESVSMAADWMKFYFYFALGNALATLFFKKNVQSVLKSNLLLILIIPVFATTQFYYLSTNLNEIKMIIVSLIGCLFMIICSFHLQSSKILCFLRILGYHSLYIYVMHVLVAAFVRFALMKILGIEQPVILLFTGILFGVTVPIIIYNKLIRNNIGWFLFSYKKTGESGKTNRQAVVIKHDAVVV